MAAPSRRRKTSKTEYLKIAAEIGFILDCKPKIDADASMTWVIDGARYDGMVVRAFDLPGGLRVWIEDERVAWNAKLRVIGYCAYEGVRWHAGDWPGWTTYEAFLAGDPPSGKYPG